MAKAYAVGKTLYLAFLLIVAMLKSTCSQLYGGHVKENQEISCTKGGRVALH